MPIAWKHHSLAAAIEAGVDPIITVLTASEHDAIGLLDDGNFESFLEVVHMGSDYRNAITGKDVW